MAALSQLTQRFGRFVFAGALATSAHYAVLVTLVEAIALEPTVGTSIGFVVGAAVSYRFNYSLTFRSSLPHVLVAPRFVVVATTGAVLNASLMWVLIAKLGLHYFFCQLIATGVVLVWSFCMSQGWAFRDVSRSRDRIARLG